MSRHSLTREDRNAILVGLLALATWAALLMMALHAC
jgi:hypothetical protein